MKTLAGNSGRGLKSRRTLYIAQSLVLAVALCMFPLHEAHAYQWTGQKWASATQTISAYSDVNGKYLTAFNEAISNYNRSTQVHLSHHNGSRWVTKVARYGNMNWAGNTLRDGTKPPYRITWATVQLNKKYLDRAPEAKVRVVCLHEFGHALGLAHSPNSRTVMYSNADVSYSKGVRYLTRDDINGINRAY